MGGTSAEAALRLPVRVQGIHLGTGVDLIVDAVSLRALGFEVRCGDDQTRFLPFAASRVTDDEIAVPSALMLLEDVAFYRSRGESFRSLRGGELLWRGKPAGAIRDLVLERDGTIVEVVVTRGGAEVRIAADDQLRLVAPSSVPAA